MVTGVWYFGNTGAFSDWTTLINVGVTKMQHTQNDPFIN